MLVGDVPSSGGRPGGPPHTLSSAPPASPPCPRHGILPAPSSAFFSPATVSWCVLFPSSFASSRSPFSPSSPSLSHLSPLSSSIASLSPAGATSSSFLPYPSWLGIDLNTTGHTVVAGEPVSGYCAKLGGEVSRLHRQFEQERSGLCKKSSSRRMNTLHHREEELIRLTYRHVSREVVDAAERLGAGIKFERLSPARGGKQAYRSAGPKVFSINSTAFTRFQRQVEEDAGRRGIPVVYVDPSFTSKRCSRCGSMGLRHRKRFDCPVCGLAIHADVNAAFNIAMQPAETPVRARWVRRQQAKVIGRQFRKTAGNEALQASPERRDGVVERVSILFSLLDHDRAPLCVPAE